MARIFKHKYADGHLSPKWYIEYRDAENKLRRKVGYLDKRSTEQEAARLEREAEQIRAGLIPAQTPQLGRDLEAHLDEWKEAVLASGTSPAQAHLLRLRVGNVFDGLKWSKLPQLNGEKAQAWLAEQSLSAQTVAHYITHLNMFGRWCVPLRLATNPFACMTKPQASSDRKHVRRVISAAEFRKLLGTTRASKPARGFDGPARAALYLVAAYTGLRASECAELRRADFTLGKSPAVTLDGQHTKNGQSATIPLPEWVAAELLPWLMTIEGRLWPGQWARSRMGARMLRDDLKTAGIAYRDDRGAVFDFHALRYFYASELARSGVGLQAAQKLLRHSTPMLTASLYTLLGFGDLAVDVAKIKRAG